MKDIILKYCLKNFYEFGSVNPKVVLGMVLREDSGLKKDVPKVMKLINEVVEEVSKLESGEIKKRLKEVAPEMLQVKKEKKIEGPLKELPNAKKGKVVVRIAPSPSGPLHIGHAYGASLNYEYAKMYKGKFIVRIEDTNPENIYAPAYELIVDDANWLTDNKVAEVVVQSSRLGIYYDHAEKLVKMGRAYVCECDADKFKEIKAKGKACPCRELRVKDNSLRYAKMFNGYAEGEAVLRLKTDIKDKNPAMRDFGIMRINEHVHPKTSKESRVWPLMVFSVAIDDHEYGVTHVMNGKEHHDNGLKEKMIMECFGWTAPEYKHWGRINFEGFKVSASKTRAAIEHGEYSGWDDIRLPFLLALRRRGYQAGAFRKYAIEIGLSLNDKTVSMEEFWKMVNAFNKEIVEEKANRYFFVDGPREVVIEGAPSRKVEIELHPDFSDRGTRKFKVGEKVFIAEKDLGNLKEGAMHRLMDYCNFTVEKGVLKFLSEDYEEYKAAKKKGRIMHWLPVEESVGVEVLMEDDSTVKGLGEKEMKKLKVGDIVQLERRYFARVDEVGKKIIKMWYLHK